MSEIDEMRAWSTDANGHPIRVGLTLEETAEYTSLQARRLAGMPSDQQRWLDLYDKHERVRLAVVMAEIEARVDKPRKH